MRLLKLAILAALVLGASALHAQGLRIGDALPVTTALTTPGPISTIPSPAVISICNTPANAVPCTNKVTTYTDSTLATPCPTSRQVVLAGTNQCVAKTDSLGNWGAWIPPGTFDFTVTLSTGQSAGPITITANVAGAGSTPGGADTQVQINGHGLFSASPCLAFNASTSPTALNSCLVINVNNALSSLNATIPVLKDVQSQGPNPFIDIRAYGARELPARISATANCSSSVNLHFTGGLFANLVNGEGIAIQQCGALNNLSTPAAPTVAAYGSQLPTFTSAIQVNPLVTGASSYQYEIAWLRQGAGITAVSAPVSISTAFPIGQQTATVTTGTRSGNVTTVNLSATANIFPGLGACVFGAGTGSFNQCFSIATTPTQSQFTYISGEDTNGGASVSSVGGTLTFFLLNHLSFPIPTGGWIACVYGRATGSFSIIGASRPQEGFWDDYGSAYVAPPSPCPSSPPSSPTNDTLVTTIVSGAPTADVVLHDAASQTISGITTQSADDPAIIAAANVAASNGGTQPGTLYIPATTTAGNFFFTSGFLDLTAHGDLKIKQAGCVDALNTWQLPNPVDYQGDAGSCLSATQFQWSPSVRFFCHSTPCIYFPNGMAGGRIKEVTLNFGNNGIGVMLANAGSTPFFQTLDTMGFEMGSGGNDYVGAAVVAYSAAQLKIIRPIVSSSAPAGLYTTMAPVFYLRGNLGGTTSPGSAFFESPNSQLRCMIGVVDVPGVGAASQYEILHGYSQGCTSLPFLRNTGNVATSLYINGYTPDTVGAPLVGNLSGGIFSVKIENVSGPNSSFVTGFPITPLHFENNYQITRVGQTRDAFVERSSYENGLPSPYNVAGTYPSVEMREPLHFTAQHTLYFDQPAPTGVTVAASSGGSIPNATTIYYGVMANSFDGGQSLIGLGNVACITGSGNNSCSVSWTPPLGAVSYQLLHCNEATCASGVAFVSGGANLTTSSFTDTTGATSGNLQGAIVAASGGIVSAGVNEGFTAPEFNLVASIAGAVSNIGTLQPVTLSANRTWNFPDYTGTVMVSTTNNPCFDLAGSVLLQYDPFNILGQGSFPCIANNRLNAVIQTPSAVNGPNVIQPGDLTVSNLILKAIASQTLPLMQFQDPTGASLGFLDPSGNLSVNSLTITNSTPLSNFKQIASPGGSAVTGYDFFFVGTDKRWHTKDDAGLDISYIGAGSTDTLTNKAVNCAVGGNVCSVNSLAVSTNVGNTTAIQRAGTFSGSTGNIICEDGSKNTTDQGCPTIPTETPNFQTNLAVTSTGDQFVNILTPGSTGLYRVAITGAVVTAGVGCGNNGTINYRISYKEGLTATVVTVDGPTFSGLNVANGAAQSLTALIYAASGVAIQGGIHVGTAASGCSTNPLVSTQMEALP